MTRSCFSLGLPLPGSRTKSCPLSLAQQSRLSIPPDNSSACLTSACSISVDHLLQVTLSLTPPQTFSASLSLWGELSGSREEVMWLGPKNTKPYHLTWCHHYCNSSQRGSFFSSFLCTVLEKVNDGESPKPGVLCFPFPRRYYVYNFI